MTTTTGATVSGGTALLTVYESILDVVEVLPAASENRPTHIDTVIVPVDTDGVTVTLYEVALLAMNPLGTPLVTDISASVRFAVGSEVAILTEIAPVRVPVAVEESIALGGMTSSTPVSVIPDATTWP